MDWYDWIATTAVLAQGLFIYSAVRNHLYVRGKSGVSRRIAHRPCTALIIPCKGLDTDFEVNIRSIFAQDYDNFRLLFVVEDRSDPAYERLVALREELGPHCRACAVQILIAGPSRVSSQKIHNLLFAIRHVPDDTEVLAFADSDVCVQTDWLGGLVWPLRQEKCGLATGYRWFIPTRNNLATLALSAINGAVAQFLGNSRFNQAWGGSMAIRRQDFDRLGMAEVWSGALSDDLSLSRAVRRAHMRIRFVPRCLVASAGSVTWSELYEFGRRQFLITRVYAPGTWWLGLLASLGSVLGLWGTAGMAVHAVAAGLENALMYVAVPLVLLAGQLIRAILRQLTAGKAFPERLAGLRPAILADVLFFWVWSLVLLALMLSSAFGRTIRWRGIRYRLNGPAEITILPDSGVQSPSRVSDRSSDRTT